MERVRDRAVGLTVGYEKEDLRLARGQARNLAILSAAIVVEHGVVLQSVGCPAT
jgi:hypothetical protein